MIPRWKANQTTSPLFNLPGEIRNQIYDYNLGGDKTILIGYTTWDMQTRQPVFRYYSFIFNKPLNPFSEQCQRPKFCTRGMTLLNGVCRQLYHETAVLPYLLNRWAFDCNDTLFTLIRSNRVPKLQWKGIKYLILPDEQPGLNLIKFMDGVETVVVVGDGTWGSRTQYEVVMGDEGLQLVKMSPSKLLGG